MKQTFFLLFFLAILTTSANDVQRKEFGHFTTIEGLSHNTVYDIEQDREGFMWIATGEGLNRYDSYGFKIYYSEGSNTSIPSNEVFSLLVCSTGRLFVGTSNGLCMFNPEYDNFTHILFSDKPIGKVSDIFETSDRRILISSNTGIYYMTFEGAITVRLPMENSNGEIHEDSNGNFWTYKGQRIFHFDKEGKVLKTYYVRPNGLPFFIPSPISSIKLDSKNQLWVGTFRDGPIVLDNKEGKFKTIPLKTKPDNSHPIYFARDIYEAADGKIWFGTEKGLFIYDPNEKTYEHYLQSFDPTLASINDNAIYRIFRSRENIMWLGTYFGGINFCEPFSKGFKTIKPGIKPDELKGKALSEMIVGPENKLWIATEDAGVAIYDQEKESFTHIFNIPQQGNTKISSNVHALSVGKDGNVWTGNFLGGVNKINPKSYSIENHSHIPGNPKSLTQNFVFSLYTDSTNMLWVGTMVGVDCYDKRKNEFSRFKPKLLRGKFIYDIFQDKQRNIWFGTYNNMGLYRYNPQKDKLNFFSKDSTEGIHNNTFISHCVDSRGKIWFGTKGGGLVFFDPDTEKFTTYDMEDGLPNNTIYGILEDDHNNLWISSNKGLTKFNYVNHEIRNFTVDHGLIGNQFNYKSYLKTADGTMYFGAVNGLTYFHPDDVKTIASEPVVHFTNLKLFNEPVLPGKKNSVLTKDIDQTREITLKYNQNVISFDFIALDMYSRGKNNFYYYMDGFETDWQSAGKNQSATYTNLPAGQYYFRVKATNIYNLPNNRERSIKLIILPPIWRTNWAYLLYFIMLSGLLFVLYRMNEIRHKEKMILKIEKIEKEKLNELHQHKLNFFTYISHEFKTPLTIILATLDAFFSGENIPLELKSRIFTLKRNALRLQFLINQLMDFRRIETDHAIPNLQSGNVIHFLREVFYAFNTLFTKKDLEYIFVSEFEELFIDFDPDKLEKIVSNLLSNAFKYTPQNGEITFRVNTVTENQTSFLQFSVADTGNGISEEKLKEIFNLFYKINDDQNEYPGSGIGLTLTQSLIKFLHGTITVESQIGLGSKFTVKLPYTAKLQVSDIHENISLNRSIIDNLMLHSSSESEELDQKSISKDFDILFVEDNKELLKFLSEHFKDKYATSVASNGLDALKSIKKFIPDLIVTDLMMPKMDGIALCRELKSSFEYCHIPIIMLTSKSDIETRLESLEVGADYYLAKPFMLPELELQIRNILIAKANLKKHFIQFGNIKIEFPVKNRDQQFIEKVTSVILENIDNSEFGVSSITKEIGIGRTLLHTKLKQILDLSATEFINTIRLKEAQRILMEEPELTMAEVAYKVGFNDPNYFSRTFKKIYNISPTNFRAGQSVGDDEEIAP